VSVVPKPDFDLDWIYNQALSCLRDDQPILAQGFLNTAAEKGHAPSMETLGRLFEEGLGVIKDFGQAIQYYEAALRLGGQEAKRHLATMYDHFSDKERSKYSTPLMRLSYKAVHGASIVERGEADQRIAELFKLTLPAETPQPPGSTKANS
jgi:TPR repeat protein